MSILTSINVASPVFVAILGAFVLLVILLAAVLMVRHRHCQRATGRAGGDHPTGRPRAVAGIAVVVLAVLGCQALTAGTVVAHVNASLHFAPTLGDAVALGWGSLTKQGAAQVVTPTPVPTTPPGATPDPRDVATFTPADAGFVKTTLSGWRSGITQDVWVWTPRGYSPDDGQTYNVMVYLHGMPGSTSGTARNLAAATALQEAIDAGRLPPSIMVIPELNADPTQRANPDCADVVGHAKVGTWVQDDVPAMIRASFPNVSAQREGWAVAGLSSGGYCAMWTALNRSDIFGSALVMSGYDRPVYGGMSTSETLKQENTLTRLLADHPHQPLHLWVLGAQDDADAYALASGAASAVPATDSLTTLTPTTGGHSWRLWASRLPTALEWWGAATSASPGGGAAAGATAATPGGTAQAGAQAGTSGGGGSLVERVTTSLHSIQGAGAITLALLAAVGLTVWSVIGPWRPKRLRTRRAWAGAVAAQALVIGASGLVMTLAVAMLINRLGDFYPTWEVALGDLAPALV